MPTDEDWDRINDEVDDLKESVELLTTAVDRIDEKSRKLNEAVNAHCTKCGRNSLDVVISPKGICTRCITTEATCYSERKPPVGDDPVNHPSHYNSHPSGVEVIRITEHMGFCLGNAVKYILRADHKGNAIEDLKKAVWYIQREIERRDTSDK